MKITVDLPANLLNEAMKVTNTDPAKGNAQVIVLALEELIKKSKIAGIKKYKGKINLEVNLNEIRDRD